MSIASEKKGRFQRVITIATASVFVFTVQYAVISNVDPSGTATTVDQSTSLLPMRWAPLYRALAFVAPVVRQPLRAILRTYRDRADVRWQSKGRLVAEGTVAREQLWEAAANTALWMIVLMAVFGVGRFLVRRLRRMPAADGRAAPPARA